MRALDGRSCFHSRKFPHKRGRRQWLLILRLGSGSYGIGLVRGWSLAGVFGGVMGGHALVKKSVYFGAFDQVVGISEGRVFLDGFD